MLPEIQLKLGFSLCQPTEWSRRKFNCENGTDHRECYRETLLSARRDVNNVRGIKTNYGSFRRKFAVMSAHYSSVLGACLYSPIGEKRPAGDVHVGRGRVWSRHASHSGRLNVIRVTDIERPLTRRNHCARLTDRYPGAS